MRVEIDVDGFEHRVRAVPGAPGNYRNLAASSEGVFYLTGDGPQTALKLFDLKAEKEQAILEGVNGYDLSADGKKLLCRKGDTYGIVDAKPGQKTSDGKLALDKLELRIDPKAEWRQMYVDAWRILRDWFYDPGMHGLDWPAIRDKYGGFAAVRRPSASTSTSFSGRWAASSRPATSTSSRASGRGRSGSRTRCSARKSSRIRPATYRITKIFPGENWHDNFRSPLTEPGVNVKVGDFILEVDGTSTKRSDNFFRLLENKADRVVTLLVSRTAGGKGAGSSGCGRSRASRTSATSTGC